MKWEEGRAHQEEKENLPAKKKDFKVESTFQVSESILTNISKNIYHHQLDKQEQFMEKELDEVLKNIKNRKASGQEEPPPEVWK